jgi:hypothetical protein
VLSCGLILLYYFMLFLLDIPFLFLGGFLLSKGFLSIQVDIEWPDRF